MNTTKDYNVIPSSESSLQIDGRPTDSRNSRLAVENLLLEERELYRKCIYNTVLTNGVPFAVVMHYLSKYVQKKAPNPVPPKHFSIKTFSFFGNVIIGSILFSPFCIQKLRIFHEENKKKIQELSGTSFPAAEGLSTPSVSEDFSYPTDVMSSFNEPESNFSSDFNPTNLLNIEEEKKFLGTTYEDLRTQHRSGKPQSEKNPPSQLNIERQDDLLSAPTKPSTFNDPPRRVTKRNKYGDEME